MTNQNIKKIDHVGIAVESLDQAIPIYTAIVGKKPDHIEEVDEQKVKAAFFAAGESNIELLEATSPESPIAKYIEKNGRAGLHHLCVEVEDIHAKLLELKEAGVKLINEEPVNGAHNKLVAFVHPKGTGGVLLELSQTKVENK